MDLKRDMSWKSRFLRWGVFQVILKPDKTTDWRNTDHCHCFLVSWTKVNCRSSSSMNTLTLHKRFNTLLHSILPAMITLSVTMEHLHYLTRWLGRPSLRREEFQQSPHNLLTCLSCPRLPRCFFSLKELCDALAHCLMYPWLAYFFLFFGTEDMSFT